MTEFLEIAKAFYKEYNVYINLGLGILLFAFFGLLRNKLSKSILSGIGKMIYKKEESKKDFVNALQKPLSVFFLILGLFALIYLNVTSSSVLKGFKIITILLICWGSMNLLSSNITHLFKSDDVDDVLNLTAVKFVSNLIRIVIIAIAVMMIISELGYNINGLITGLGIGGLAVSLAAQDAVKNLISGFIIVFDKPFVVGDFIQIGDTQGTVLEVTMRSSKIRKLDDSIVTMPNSKLVDDSVTNISRIEKRLIDEKIELVYSTDNDTVEKCISDIKEYLISNDLIINEPIRVEFSKFEDSSLNICIFCYTTVTEINAYYSVLNDVNLNIKRIVENNNAEFAFPSRSVYIEKQ